MARFIHDSIYLKNERQWLLAHTLLPKRLLAREHFDHLEYNRVQLKNIILNTYSCRSRIVLHY